MATDPNALAAQFIQAQMARNQADKMAMITNDREDARNQEWYRRLDAGTEAKMGLQNNAANVKQQAADQTGQGLAAMQFAMQEFKNPYAAAAYAANMQAESGFDPNRIGDTNLGPGREAHGRFQWREERQTRRQAFIAANGGSPDLATDMRYSIAEMKQYYPQVYQRLMNAKSVADANGAMRQYLIYDNSQGEELNRLALTNDYFIKAGKLGGPKEFANGASVSTGDPDSPDQVATTNELSNNGKSIVTSKPGVIQSKSLASSIRGAEAKKGYTITDDVQPGTGGKPTTATFQREVPTIDALRAKYGQVVDGKPTFVMPSYTPGQTRDPNLVPEQTLAGLARPVVLGPGNKTASASDALKNYVVK